jgi:palmitoyltransferase
MTLSHIAMVCSAMTTIESYSIRDQRDRESHLLAQKYGFFKCRTKTRTLRRWNYEYGDLKTEGNRWYVGGPMREWKLLMGDAPLGWIRELTDKRILLLCSLI